MSKQHTPEPFELVVTTVPVVFEDSDKDDAYDKVDRHLRNSLGDTDYQEYSEALDKVADCSKLTEQRDDLQSVFDRQHAAAEALAERVMRAEAQRDELLAELLRVRQICLREVGVGIVDEVVIANVKGGAYKERIASVKGGTA